MRIWKIPEDGLKESVIHANITLSSRKPVELIQFHPTAENMIASASHDIVAIWDSISEKSILGKIYILIITMK